MTKNEEKLEKSIRKAEKLGVFTELRRIHKNLHKKSK